MRSSQSNHPLTAIMTETQQSTANSHANTLMSFKPPLVLHKKAVCVCRHVDNNGLSSRYAPLENKQIQKQRKQEDDDACDSPQ